MAESIKDQVAVITGAGRGIGRAAAVALAREGVHLALTARTASDLDSLVSECFALGVRAEAFPADATDPAAVEDVRAKALAAFGQVDILINNAGVAKYAPLVETTIDDYDWMMDTNMRSTYLFTRAFLPGMVERKHGAVIVVSSQAGVNGFPNEAIYCATKHAQVGFACALDGEVREQGVKVSVIAPGGVNTTFAFGTGREPGMPALEHMIGADDVAEAILFAVTRPAKSRVLMIGMRPMSEKLYGGA